MKRSRASRSGPLYHSDVISRVLGYFPLLDAFLCGRVSKTWQLAVSSMAKHSQTTLLKLNNEKFSRDRIIIKDDPEETDMWGIELDISTLPSNALTSLLKHVHIVEIMHNTNEAEEEEYRRHQDYGLAIRAATEASPSIQIFGEWPHVLSEKVFPRIQKLRLDIDNVDECLLTALSTFSSVAHLDVGVRMKMETLRKIEQDNQIKTLKLEVYGVKELKCALHSMGNLTRLKQLVLHFFSIDPEFGYGIISDRSREEYLEHKEEIAEAACRSGIRNDVSIGVRGGSYSDIVSF